MTLNVAPAPVPALHTDDLAHANAGRHTMGAVFATRGVPVAGAGDVVARKLFVWGTGEAGQLSLGTPDEDNINKLTKAKPFFITSDYHPQQAEISTLLLRDQLRDRPQPQQLKLWG